jgi:hypothetical protein
MSVSEGGSVTVTVRRVGGSEGAASVRWVVVGGNATPGTDYTTPFTGIVSFAAGKRRRRSRSTRSATPSWKGADDQPRAGQSHERHSSGSAANDDRDHRR